jgi:NYN domain
MSEFDEGPVHAPTRSYAIFVDAGYLVAAAGDVMLGTPNRTDFRIDSARLVDALLTRAKRSLGDGLLRLYWFDAARDRVPTVEQRQIAALPHVKVRLGNLNRYGAQKGVDALIRTDIVALARHRAVSDIILVAGDEDMVPGVEDAQAYGVRVHVWGVEPRYGTNQAERLIWEADTTDELAASFFNGMVTVTERRHVRSSDFLAGTARDLGDEKAGIGAAGTGEFAAVSAEAVPVSESGPATEGAHPDPAADLDDAAHAEDGVLPDGSGRRTPSPATVAAVATARPLVRPQLMSKTQIDLDEIVDVGEHIANKWLLTRGREFLADLLPGPFLPSVVDKELLVAAEQEIRRSLRPHPEARARLRDGFWQRLIREFGAPDTKVG